MPQIGWFEILVVVVLAILIVGPKEFPIMIKKVGRWVGSFKKYFNDVQRDVVDIENSIEEDIYTKEDLSNILNNKKKDE